MVSDGSYGVIVIGGDRAGDAPANALAERLGALDRDVGRLKTGTPPRFDGRSVDFTALDLQAGDDPAPVFPFAGARGDRPRPLAGLYLAGQVNGTTGYEEAAAQARPAAATVRRRDPAAARTGSRRNHPEAADLLRRPRIDYRALTPLPAAIDCDRVPGLSAAARQRLAAHRPATVGQAGRIEGATPAAVSLLLVHPRRRQRDGLRPAG